MPRTGNISLHLGRHRKIVDKAVEEMSRDRIVARIRSHDHTVWKPEPTEITNRLGWLDIAERMRGEAGRVSSLADKLRAGGYTDALLLGMGGSSLAPEVLRRTLGVKKGYLDLAVLDSTSPGAVLRHARRLKPARSLFIVSTKSGTTVETLSFFKFFYNWMIDAVGSAKAGEHFVAITDPGSKLAELARERKFRDVFPGDPNIGGRYSALSHFGLAPAALIGADVGLLLERGMEAARADDSAALLGATMGALAKAGRDKLTLLLSPQIESFGDWVEQLIAESTGKEGRGILPVVGEAMMPPEAYSDDRLFVCVSLGAEAQLEAAAKQLMEANQPVVQLRLNDAYDLGGQFFLWEMATAVAGHILAINPFDQPNVEAAKVLARKMVDEYLKRGAFPEEHPAAEKDGLAAYGDVEAASPAEALRAFIEQGKHGAYIAIQAYLAPTPETDAALARLRKGIGARSRLATTVGYGPRFLHSTGQLHKGDAGKGLFVQLTAQEPDDAPIPDEPGSTASSITFGILKAAQALGDIGALKAGGRRALRIDLGRDVLKGLKRLADAL